MSVAARGRAAAEVLRVAAPAKLNLYLHILGRRADGYHLIDSLVAFASIHDTLVVEAADALALSLEGPFGPALAAERDNLVLRAARLLARETGAAPRAKLRLIKRLPLASGIGGGSADAAAALKALRRLWRLSLSDSELARIALALGADLPACLEGRSAFVGGIGEALATAPALPEAGTLLVNPGVALATPAVYAARAGAFSRPARFGDRPRDARGLAALLATRRNDLTAAATSLCPAIGEVLAALSNVPGCRLVRMSGSGATCFGLFDDEAGARRGAKALARPGWWTASGRLVADAAALVPA